ncbi:MULTISPECIES: nuclear transport factor 2 family protein [unclassified Bradyrhizobium]|uniref:YybH family protein n=1 Tax=unclassified Bradyrhizobium TaxID=2631580 RepID=UPI002446ABFC|nr:MULTISPECIES: nuclear transport factor 2 family protein [unclassified Bradyrhizobium]MDH2347965.1 DUF4440 domain-containing protein [Bradyrhizobium sp. SSUT77]MDH2355728.1 DUF4440 domain-containing protein [Bradyrhizobium sp. SSUT112]
MRLIHAAAFTLCLLTVAPVGSFAGDPKSDVSSAYAAFDTAFNKGDAKAVAALYLPNAKVLPPTHEVASGPAAIEKFFARLHANGVTDHKLEVIDAGVMTRSSMARQTGAPKARTRMASQRPSLASPPTCSSVRRMVR